MDQPDSPEPPDDLLLFAPVATAYRGANGWSSDVQRAFVGALARCGVVAAAARSVGRSASSAYRLRNRAGTDSPFARAWDAAMMRAAGDALDMTMSGGIVARRTEVYYRGRMVGWRTHHDDRLAVAALRTFGRRDAGPSAIDGDATMLFEHAMELRERRDMCDPSGDGGAS